MKSTVEISVSAATARSSLRARAAEHETEAEHCTYDDGQADRIGQEVAVRHCPMRDASRGEAEMSCLAVLPQRSGHSQQQSDQGSSPSAGREVATVLPSSADRHGREVAERQDEELHARRNREGADQRYREGRPARGRLYSVREHGDRAEENGIGERFRHEVAVVEERRRRYGRGRCEQRERRAHDARGEPIRGKDGRRHQGRVDQLGRGVGVHRRAEQPRGRLNERGQNRREEVVLPAE